MTAEDDFWELLEENPDDYQTRLIFADWLQDRNDDRAEGMRALGRTRLRPLKCGFSDEGFYYIVGNYDRIRSLIAGVRDWDQYSWKECVLPADWFLVCPKTDFWDSGSDHWRCYQTQRKAETAAALAFTRLPPERRTALLEGGL
jgi:uncharacterized protein (TIGR02996 family)